MALFSLTELDFRIPLLSFVFSKRRKNLSCVIIAYMKLRSSEVFALTFVDRLGIFSKFPNIRRIFSGVIEI